jgi:hypothetical protein
LNLVASNLQLASLPEKDPSIAELRLVIESETGMPSELTDAIVQALRGADHLGSLLKIDAAVDEAIAKHESQLAIRLPPYNRDLFGDSIESQQVIDFDAMSTRRTLLAGLERFLNAHTGGVDLGLRMRGNQLATGVRFMRLIREVSYDIVVANPPYQGVGKLLDDAYIQRHYTLGKSDLYSAFLSRALQLVREGGVVAMLTMRNWMFLRQFFEFRQDILCRHFVRCIGDFDRGAFHEIPDELVSVVATIIERIRPDNDTTERKVRRTSVAVLPTPLEDRSRDSERTLRKQCATLVQRSVFKFDQQDFLALPQCPIMYWWSRSYLEHYQAATKLGELSDVRTGMATSNNTRFLRYWWEVPRDAIYVDHNFQTPNFPLNRRWVPYIKGAEDKQWFEPLCDVLYFGKGNEFTKIAGATIRNPSYYFRRGVAFSSGGNDFKARLHRYASVFDVKGQSVFPDCCESVVICLNSKETRTLVSELNPTVSFQVGDVQRTLVTNSPYQAAIIGVLSNAFDVHEGHRETSIEFRRPGGSPWRNAQLWAQEVVDLPKGKPAPEYIEVYDCESSIDHLSYAVGLAFGRFRDSTPSDELVNHPSQTLPYGVLYLDCTLDDSDLGDSLGHASTINLIRTWEEYGASLASRTSLRRWLAQEFFSSVHKDRYESHPIYLPVSSRNRNFVALVYIHTWNANTLRSLLAEHLQGSTLPRLDGELTDLRNARAEGIKGSDSRFLELQKWKAELDEFMELLKVCIEKGAPPTDDDCPKREADARYDPDLDDGVMINSAAIWPLLEPQWKDPKKWWRELAIASSKGNRDYDWSHLASRYFPKRVDDKCQKDPSLAVAHCCFWKYHPAKAWGWELRLQDEIAPDFRIEEASYRGDGGDVEHRAAYLRDNAIEAIASIEKEVHRRRKDAPGKFIQELTILEPGLWSTEPEACWDMETRIIKKQEFGFRLIAPDEAEARAKLIAETPQKETGRRRMLEGKGGSAAYLAGWEEAMENS